MITTELNCNKMMNLFLVQKFENPNILSPNPNVPNSMIKFPWRGGESYSEFQDVVKKKISIFETVLDLIERKIFQSAWVRTIFDKNLSWSLSWCKNHFRKEQSHKRLRALKLDQVEAVSVQITENFSLSLVCNYAIHCRHISRSWRTS